jgi:hypothetical protein
MTSALMTTSASSLPEAALGMPESSWPTRALSATAQSGTMACVSVSAMLLVRSTYLSEKYGRILLDNMKTRKWFGSVFEQVPFHYGTMEAVSIIWTAFFI